MKFTFLPIHSHQLMWIHPLENIDLRSIKTCVSMETRQQHQYFTHLKSVKLINTLPMFALPV